MLVAERKAGVLNRVKQVEDEQVLKMIEAILEVHLGAVDDVSADEAVEEIDIPYFNPLKYHSEAEIKQHESREDFWGYGVDGQPVYGEDVDKSYQKWIEDVKNGTVIPITHEEVKAKWDKKFAEWRSRTQ